MMGTDVTKGFWWSKWLTFSFATLLQLSSGLGYTFSIYSNDLKHHFKCACGCCVHEQAPLEACSALALTIAWHLNASAAPDAGGVSSRQQPLGQHATSAATSRCLLACSTTT